EEPYAVLHHEAAEVESALGTGVLGLDRRELGVSGRARRRGAVAGRRRALADHRAVEVLRRVLLLVRGEAQVVVVPEDSAVELVPAGLRDHVDHAAGVATFLGLVAAGLDFDFLNELVVDVFALDALDDVRGVDTVDDETVLGRGRAVDRDREGAAL